jgi:hypothetical protein
MRRILLGLALVIACAAAHADSYRFSGGLVMDGDSVATLIKHAGQPSRIVQLENRFGAAVGERWDYYIDDKLVSFYITGGRVTSISEAR